MAIQSGIPIVVREPEGFDPNNASWMTAIAPDAWRWDSQDAAQTERVIWTPRQGRRILFMGVLISTRVARWIRVETSGDVLIPPIFFGARGGANLLFTNGLLLGVNATLSYSSVGDGRHSIMFYGKEL